MSVVALCTVSAASACMDAIPSAYVLIALVDLFAATALVEPQHLSSDQI